MSFAWNSRIFKYLKDILVARNRPLPTFSQLSRHSFQSAFANVAPTGDQVPNHLKVAVLGRRMQRDETCVGGLQHQGFVGGCAKGTKDLHHLAGLKTRCETSISLDKSPIKYLEIAQNA